LAERVFLHIGAPKTGTTFLQQLMADNVEALEAQGVRYAAGTYHNDRVWATNVLRGMDFSDHPRPHASGAWDRILEQIRSWDGDAVYSHEFLGGLTPEQTTRAHRDLAPADVHVVVTARDYVRQAAAVWQERLKYGFATPLSEFTLDPGNGTPAWSWRTQDLVAIVDRWRHHLPADHVHVVTVPPAGSGPSGALWQRFASVIGVDPESCTARSETANTSLGLVEAELLQRLGSRLDTVAGTRQDRAAWVRDVLANTVLASGSRERFTVPSHYAAELVDKARRDVETLREQGYHVVGSLDDLVPEEPLPSSRQPEDVSTDELLDAALDTVAGLLAEMKRRSNRERRAGRGAGAAESPVGRVVGALRRARGES
jgi:hypothetical protein